MLARDVMIRDVVTVRDDTLLSSAIDLLVDRKLSGLPVIDDERRLVGVITEGDLLRRVELETGKDKGSRWHDFLVGPGRIASAYVRAHSRRVGDLMTRDVATVEETAPLADVVALMEERHIKRVPVVANGILVGQVSRIDLVRILGRALHDAETAAAHLDMTDAAILTRLDVELRAQRWYSAGVEARVNDGVVTLEGVISDERARDALRVAAENVPGVKSVDEHLVWVGPGAAVGMPII